MSATLDLQQFLPTPWPRDAAGNRVKWAGLSPEERERQDFQAMERLQAVLDTGKWDGRLAFQTHRVQAVSDAARPRKVSK